MDPLTILGAISGSISVASEIFRALDAAISTASKAKKAPKLALSTLRDVDMMRRNIERFQSLQDFASTSLERRSCIALDATRNTFTDCVTSLDELEGIILPLADPRLAPMTVSERLKWAMKDKDIQQVLRRVHNAQSSLGLMLEILQSESLLEVRRAMATFTALARKIDRDVAHLNRRCSAGSSAATEVGGGAETDDSFTIQPPPIRHRPGSITITETADRLPGDDWPLRQPAFAPQGFAFDKELERSRPYRTGPQWGPEDMSSRSSKLTGKQSLNDVSIISFIALPIYPQTLYNSQRYTFGEPTARNALLYGGPEQTPGIADERAPSPKLFETIYEEAQLAVTTPSPRFLKSRRGEMTVRFRQAWKRASDTYMAQPSSGAATSIHTQAVRFC